MNVFIREMKANEKSLIIWGIAIVLMIASSMGKYVSLSLSGQSVNDLMGQMPNSLKAIMGLGTFDLSTASGYFGVLFIYLALMTTIHAVLLGANIISKEERDRTAEFLFIKPASRNRIVTAKLLASLINIFIINLITLVSSILLVQKYAVEESVAGDIARLMIGMFIIQLIFLFIGTAIAAISKNPKSATSVSTGILLSTFILSIVIDMNTRLASLKYLTPFKYFDAKNIMYDRGFELVYVVISVVLIASLLSMTFIAYKKRDLKV